MALSFVEAEAMRYPELAGKYSKLGELFRDRCVAGMCDCRRVCGAVGQRLACLSLTQAVAPDDAGVGGVPG